MVTSATSVTTSLALSLALPCTVRVPVNCDNTSIDSGHLTSDGLGGDPAGTTGNVRDADAELWALNSIVTLSRFSAGSICTVTSSWAMSLWWHPAAPTETTSSAANDSARHFGELAMPRLIFSELMIPPPYRRVG